MPVLGRSDHCDGGGPKTSPGPAIDLLASQNKWQGYPLRTTMVRLAELQGRA